MQQLQLVSFALAMAAAVCGCNFTLKSRKKLPTETLRPAVPDEHQPGCFALEEERGGNWTGSSVPVIKEARPTL
jgi:outer membrane lipopolysaccharide assembly protein LptE/RlpB